MEGFLLVQFGSSSIASIVEPPHEYQAAYPLRGGTNNSTNATSTVRTVNKELEKMLQALSGSSEHNVSELCMYLLTQCLSHYRVCAMVWHNPPLTRWGLAYQSSSKCITDLFCIEAMGDGPVCFHWPLSWDFDINDVMRKGNVHYRPTFASGYYLLSLFQLNKQWSKSLLYYILDGKRQGRLSKQVVNVRYPAERTPWCRILPKINKR